MNPDLKKQGPSLADKPYVWVDHERYGYRARWVPGAFGDRTSIEDVRHFKVIEDEWLERADGTFERTIITAEVLEP